MTVLTLIGWGFLITSWFIPHRPKNRFMGVALAAAALVFFVIDLIIHLTKNPLL